MNRSKLKSASAPSSRFPSMSSHQIDSRISWYYEEVEDSDDSSTNDRHSSIWSSPKAKEFFLSGIEIRDSSSVQSPLKFVEEGS